MIIPKKLKIGGHIIKVKVEACNNMGEYDATKNEITILKSAPQSQKESTLIHEIFHALNTTLSGGHNFSHSLLDSLSEQFYQVLSDNKLLDQKTCLPKKQHKKKSAKKSSKKSKK